MAYDLNALESGYQQQLKAPRQPVAPKKKGNFLTSLIPSAGGIGGSLGGAALGTAILPGVGTLAGALLGGALGGGAGKVAENAVEGNKITNGVAGEAALNGVLGAGPLRLGKLGVDTIRGVKAGTGLADALTSAGTNAAGMNAAQAIGDKLQKSGQNLIAKEFRLSPTQQANFAKLHGEEATSVLRRYGVKSPQDIQAKIQPLQETFDSAISGIPAVSKNDLAAGLKKVYQPLIKSPALFEQGLGNSVKQQADELLKLAKNGSLPADKVNELRKTFDAAVNYTQRGAPEYNVIKKTADALRGTLQSAADKAGVKTPDGLSFKEVGKELRKLYGLDEVVGKQAYLGTGSLPLNLPNLLGTTAGGAAGGLPGAAAAGVATQLINSTAGRRLAANGVIGAGEKLSARGATASPYGVKAITGRVAPVGLTEALMGSAGQSDGNSMATNATSTNTATMPNSTNIPPLNQTNGYMSSSNSPFAPNNLETSIEKILANGGSLDDVSKFVTIAGAVQKAQSVSAPKLNSTQQQQANNAQSGLDSLAAIAQTLQSNPNAAKLASLPGGSLTQSLTHTGAYAAALNNATDVIGRLRSGGAINADEEKRFKALLPGSFDSPDTINYKLNTLATLFQSFANPQSAQPDATDLASALGM
jgi:hypothetical protein